MFTILISMMSLMSYSGLSKEKIRLDHPNGYVCYRASHPLSMNGKLDDPAWKNAPWTEYFVDIEGDKKPLPRYKTRAKMLWDDTYLYIGAELEEPHVWGTLTQHDSVIFQDNDFEIFIDPDGDNHEYYEIEINALNTEWDLRLVKPYRNGGPALNEWEIPGYKSAVHINGTINNPADIDKGWTVELALPWKVLKEYANRPSPPHDGDQWRINFSRVEWLVDIIDGNYVKVPNKPEDNWVWSPQGYIDMHRPETYGYIQFSTAAPGTEGFIPDPTYPARAFLIKLYEAQAAYHGKHGKWADAFSELLLPIPSDAHLKRTPEIKLTSDGYEITVQVKLKDNHTRELRIRQDSKLWVVH